MKLGLIGYSKDNGHPFSFSAIINGFSRDHLHLNPITPINEYLINQSSDKFGIGDLQVTHVWTQDRTLSEAIAQFSNISNIVDDYNEMLDQVDGLLILRDDRHLEIAASFLEKGKYVFIDKPLAIHEEELDFFLPYLKKSQLMSCSGLRYFPAIDELIDFSDDLKFVYCTTIDNWFNYGIHSIEGVMSLCGGAFDYVQYIGDEKNRQFKVMLKSGVYLLINLESGFNGGIRSHLYFKNHEPVEIHYNDNFNSFRNTLLKFHEQITTLVPAIDPMETIGIIRMLIAGEESKKLDGKRIRIDG